MAGRVPQRPSLPGERLASLDLGSHTARMLIAERVEAPEVFRSLARERSYIRLAEGTGPKGIIGPAAVEKTLTALKDFRRIAQAHRVRGIHGVATGIMRSASNRDSLLDRIAQETGIHVRVITGEEEAALTSMGVLHCLNRGGRPTGIFDLGGATTECIVGEGEALFVRSLPLGAMTLTRAFLHSDPPLAGELDALTGHVDRILREHLSGRASPEMGAVLVGTGGTITTLGAMIHGIPHRDITPEVMNGLILKARAIEALFRRMKGMPTEERVFLPGLDQGRADVIVAGTLVVLRIMDILGYAQVSVSMSDILEVVLLAALGLETNEPGSGAVISGFPGQAGE